MKHKNSILFAILIILSIIVFVLPHYTNADKLSPTTQLTKLVSTERLITSDELADKLVNKDPSIVLIDVRTKLEYENYHIPTAINIPFENLLDKANDSIINQDKVTVVFYSNDQLIADRAWFLCFNLNYKNLVVLKDGLNGFYNTILNPEAPNKFASEDERKLYSFRKAAGIYFGVPYHNAPEKVEIKVSSIQPTVKKVETVKKVKVEIEEGGC